MFNDSFFMKKIFTEDRCPVYFVLALCVLGMSLAGCRKNGPGQEPVFRLAGPDEIVVEPSGGEFSIRFEIENPAPSGAVSAGYEADWIDCPAVPEGDSLVVQVFENLSEKERSAVIRLNYSYDGGEQPLEVEFVQKGASDDPDIPDISDENRIEADFFKGVYNGTVKSTSSGYFTVEINDNGCSSDEGYLPDGCYVRLEVYTSKQHDPRYASIPTGTYVYRSGETEPETSGSISGEYSSLVITDEDGDIYGEYMLVEAELEVTDNGGGEFVYDLTVTTDDEITRNIIYKGVAVFTDESGEPIPLNPVKNDIKTEFGTATAVLYSTDENGISNILLNFSDMERNLDGLFVPPGNLLQIDLFGAIDASGMISEGSYRADTTGSAGAFTYTAGFVLDLFGTLIPGGSYNTAADASAQLSYGFLTGGTLDIKHEGETYHIGFNLEMEGGYVLSASYEGPIVITDRYPEDPEPEPDPVYTTLTEDVVADFTKGEMTAKAGYFGRYYSSLTSNWIVNILPAEGSLQREGLHIEFCDEFSEYDGNIPAGTYVAGYAYEPDTFVPGYMHDGALQGTWYVLYDENGNISGYAPAMEGEVDIVKNGDGTYTVSFLCYDDAETPHSFEGEWSGEIVVSDETGPYENYGTGMKNSRFI